jgi:hypothetical protein
MGLLLLYFYSKRKGFYKFLNTFGDALLTLPSAGLSFYFYEVLVFLILVKKTERGLSKP